MSAVFPFGKWRGRPYADIPEHYFRWCLSELKRLEPDVRRAIERELARRRGELPLDVEPGPDVTVLERKLAAAEDPVHRRIFEAAGAFVRSMEGV